MQWQTDPRNGRGVLHSGGKSKYSPDHRGSHFQTTFKLYEEKREKKKDRERKGIGERHKSGRERKKKGEKGIGRRGRGGKERKN